MENVLHFVSWLGAPLFVALLVACVSRKTRHLAVATLIIAVPFALLVATNNNHANVARNFFMGILLFSLPLLFHAFLAAAIRRRQGDPNAI